MRILANSIPKAGTHLLKRCLQLLHGVQDTGIHLDLTLPVPALREKLAALPDGAFVTAHLPGEPPYIALADDLDYRVFLMVRDPRDLAVSSAKFIMKDTTHYLHDHYRRLPDEHARIMASIAGVTDRAVPWYPVAQCDIGELCRIFLPWRNVQRNLLVRFEDLIGPAGGGSRQTQLDTIAAIIAHIGLRPGDFDLPLLADRVFDTNSPTFRKGEIGDWRNHLSDEHRRVLKQLAGQVLIDLGYERDLEW